MYNKSSVFLAVVLLIALPQLIASTSVSVGDNQPWDQFAFSSSIKLPSLYVN